MHQDNKPHLISLCSLMSQLKGLVLLLAMGLAVRIVCRLVCTGLWRSWSPFKAFSCSTQTFLYAHIGALAASRFRCQMAGVARPQWSVGVTTHSEIYSAAHHI